MIDKLIAKIKKRYAFSDAEENLLRSKMREQVEFNAGDVMVAEGDEISYSSLLIDGLACRSKYTRDGDRQIMEFGIPGDFLDLHSYPLESLDHSVTAISDCRIIKLQHRDITELIRSHLRFARIFWFATMTDASIHREWLVNLGARSGVGRVAHLLCEMYFRLRVVGMTSGTSYHFPVTQDELGQALGFTPVHTNRLLRELRDRDLVTFRAKTVSIRDLADLQNVAGFDADYLFLEPRKH